MQRQWLGRVRGNLGFALPLPCEPPPPEKIWRQIGAACGYCTAWPRSLPDHDGMDEQGRGDGGCGAALHSVKVGITRGWHRVHVACPGQGTEQRQRDMGGGPAAGTPLIFGAKAPHQCRVFFGAPRRGAAGARAWDASERARLQPATDFTTLGVPREGEEGSRQRARIPSRGLPVIPFLARESLG